MQKSNESEYLLRIQNLQEDVRTLSDRVFAAESVVGALHRVIERLAISEGEKAESVARLMELNKSLSATAERRRQDAEKMHGELRHSMTVTREVSGSTVLDGAPGALEPVNPVYPPVWRRMNWAYHLAIFNKAGKDPHSIEIARFTALALAGEAGELANLIKKEWRPAWGYGAPVDPNLWTQQIKEEMADICVYLFQLAGIFRFDLDKMAHEKFSKVLERMDHAMPEAVKAARDAEKLG